MISVFKSSESVTAPEGQYNQPTTLGAGRGVSKRCEQFHRAAEKDMFGVNLKKINLSQRPVFGGLSNKNQLESLLKVSTGILTKTLKLSKIRNRPIEADSMLKICLSPVISHKHGLFIRLCQSHYYLYFHTLAVCSQFIIVQFF